MTNHRHATLQDQRGFSLIEIMVTLGVLALVAALATPAIMSMAPNMRLRTATNDLHANLMRAKSRAVKDNRNVGFSVTTVNCVPAVFAPGGNGGAYRIFIDDGGGDLTKARNNTWDAAHVTGGTNYPAEEILVDVNDTSGDGIDDLPESVAICAQGFNATAPPTTATTGFTSTGLLQNAASGNVTLTNSQGDQYRVSLSPAGGVATEKL